MTDVAHILRKYNPAEWGGTETHVVEVVTRLSTYGFDAEVHAPSGPSAADTALGKIPLRRFHAFSPFVATPEKRKALLANAGNIASFHEPLRLVMEKRFGLAHLHTAGRIGGAVRTAMRLTGRPYVISVHGPMLANRDWLVSETEKRMTGVLDLGKPIGAIFGARRVLDDAARIITFNEEERIELAKRYGARAVRMDHGVNIEKLSKGDAHDAGQRWPAIGKALEENTPLVLLVGRLAAQKNHELAMAAFAKGAPAHAILVFAGAQTDQGYLAKMQDAARALGIGERVLFLGNVAPGEVPHLFAAASLALVPSHHEAFGLAVLEAWAAGRPVLFARHSGMTDIADALGDERAYLRSLQIDEWAAAIKASLADDAQRQQMAAVGMVLVKTRYSWDAVAERLAALYRQVLAEHR